MHLLVTRPEPDGLTCKTRLEANGHAVTLHPLVSIVPCLGETDFAGVQALIVTSRHALSALAARPALAEAAALPLFAVGPATAALARRCGFSTVYEGPGSARDLVQTVSAAADPAAGALLYLAGDPVAFDMRAALSEEGYRVRQETAYRQEAAQAFTPAVADGLACWRFDAVVLMSARASEIYVQLVRRAGFEAAARRLLYFCLSRTVTQGLSALGVVRAEIPARPDSDAMLALVNAAAKPC